MTSVALITGATSGIGAEFARQLASQGNDLVLVARDTDRLAASAENLTSRYGVSVEVLPADLLTTGGLAAVESRVGAAERSIAILVNNAGFGLPAPFHENDVELEQQLLDLLVAVPMRLTHAALGQMIPRRAGTIINIASVAGFTPRGTYGAAKAWVLSFSRWANIHYRSQGITVTAVAPGFVRTEFHERMRVHTDNIPNSLWLNAEVVVRHGLRAAARGKAVTVPTFRYKVVVWFSSWLPKRIVAAGALRGR